jgi:nitrogen fixation/metabolism regulation signal transduction histidine kinase
MTRKLALARQQQERQRAYLEAILAHLSSGVLTVGRDCTLRTANAAAGHILGVDLTRHLGQPLIHLAQEHPHLQPLIDALLPQVSAAEASWHVEVALFSSQRQVLMCRGSPLPSLAEMPAAHVIVFDDITTLIQAQRNAAWAEVARRLAHEIKNPLTPIQLSAERLRHKYLKQLTPEAAEVLDRLTHTIIQQVMMMKEMVNTFSEYARTPQVQLRPLNLNTLITEVIDLYRGHVGGEGGTVQIETDLAPELFKIEADPGRLRQLLHNLIKNSLEALEHQTLGRVRVVTRGIDSPTGPSVELRVEDNGPGIPESILGQLFEPYVTTKPKGTGLGLPIVKKIVEEHGGLISAENLAGGGAAVVIRFPVKGPEHRSTSRVQPAEVVT